MPVQSVWLIRLSLIYFFIAVVLGGILLSHKVVEIHPSVWALLPLHFEMAIWGWIIQFVLGTAYWMFPRFLKTPKRGSSLAAWYGIILFNAGIITVLLSHLISSQWLRIPGRFLILAGIVTFIGLMWGRVVTYRNRN